MHARERRRVRGPVRGPAWVQRQIDWREREYNRTLQRRNLWPYKDVEDYCARFACPYSKRLPFGKLPTTCGKWSTKDQKVIQCTSTLTDGMRADSCPQSGPKSMCAGRLAAWDPEKWANPEAAGAQPHVSAARLKHVCGSIMVHVARPEWRDLLDFNRSNLWDSKYVMRSPATRSVRLAAEQKRCVARLRSFRPRVCSLENVFVYGNRKRMYTSDGFYLPPQAGVDPLASPEKNVLSEHICNESTSVIACVGHAVLSRNAVGTGR